MKNKKLTCPYCTSTDFDYIGGYIDDNIKIYYVYECKCNKCKKNFKQFYLLTYSHTEE